MCASASCGGASCLKVCHIEAPPPAPALLPLTQPCAACTTPPPTLSCLLYRRPYLMDLGSTNGTFLNGERIDSQRYYELLEKVGRRAGEDWIQVDLEGKGLLGTAGAPADAPSTGSAAPHHCCSVCLP